MTLHHFVPLFIIKTFASDQAWKLVKETLQKRAQIARNDKLVIKSGQKRNWPVCVYEKDYKRFTRKLAGNVCSMANLYGVLNHEDQLVRALIRYNLESQEIPLDNLTDLLKLGEKPLDSDMIESIHVGRIDASFSAILPALKAGMSINEDQISVIYRYITFARFRTPSWRRVYFHEAFEKQKKILDLFTANWNHNHQRQLLGRSLDAVKIAIDNNLYQMAIVSSCTRESSALHQINARVRVLHNLGNVPFITCDNPARPYFSDRIHRINTEPIPGMKLPRSQITYPINPTSCLLISSDPSYPIFGHEEVREKHVRRINSALAISADKEIIFKGPDTKVFENWLDLSQMTPTRRP